MRKASIKFAQLGGTPKGAPHCYGAPEQESRIQRKLVQHCHSCDMLLQAMCNQFHHFLLRKVRARKIAWDKQKDIVKEEYKIRAEGKGTTAKFERMKRRKSKPI